MRDVVVAVFWIWLLVALGVYAYRIYRRVSPGARAEREAPATTAPTLPLDPTSGGPAAPGATPSSPPPTSPPSPSPPPPSPGPTPAHPTPAASDPPAGAPEHDGRTGLFAPRSEPAAPGPTGDPTPGRPTVAEAVAGIALPCELAPLVGGETRLDPYRVVFFTDRADAATVGAGLGDELERLGYAIRSTSDHEAVAVRDDASLTISIVTASDDFPTAPPGSVVVVLTT